MSVQSGIAGRHHKRELSQKSSQTTGRFECFRIGARDFQASPRLIPTHRGMERSTELRHFARDAQCIALPQPPLFRPPERLPPLSNVAPSIPASARRWRILFSVKALPVINASASEVLRTCPPPSPIEPSIESEDLVWSMSSHSPRQSFV